MKRRLLAVFAHPDDEAFGPAGTIAKYVKEGVEVHVLTATKGEAGLWQQKEIRDHPPAGGSEIRNVEEIRISEKVKIEHVREKELLQSAKILGVTKVEFLDFIDGTLCNAVYHKLAHKIIKKIQNFQPHIVITFDRFGISGHLDHVAVSLTTTYAYLHSSYPKKLYYLVMTKRERKVERNLDNYFIYFPEGHTQDEVTTRIDYTPFWDLKVAAMVCHRTQMKDVKEILERVEKLPKVDHFILHMHRGIDVKFPETDLFAGIG